MDDIYHADPSKMHWSKVFEFTVSHVSVPVDYADGSSGKEEFKREGISYKAPRLEESIFMQSHDTDVILWETVQGCARHIQDRFLKPVRKNHVPYLITKIILDENRLPTPKEIHKLKIQEALR